MSNRTLLLNTMARETWQVRLMTAVLFALAAVYLWAAFTRLVFDVPGSYPIDLRLRWIEHRFLADGLNPQLHGHPGLPDSHAQMRDQGGSYPPWAYSIGSLLVPPMPFEWVRWYYAGLCALALAVLAARAFRDAGWLGAAAVLAVFSGAICVSYGQYAIVIAGLVAAAAWALERDRQAFGGLLLGLGFVKPQLCALFLLMTLLEGYGRTVVVAALTIAVASLVTSWLVWTPPWDMLTNFGGEAALYYWLSHNPLLPWLVGHVGFKAAVGVLGLAGIAAALTLWRVQGPAAPLVHRFAVAAVITMFWSYRRHYDTVIMALMLAPLLGLALRSGWRTRLLALLVGLSLWAPIRHTQWDLGIVKVAHLLLWLGAAGAIVLDDRGASRRAAVHRTGCTA